jgi:hypothetical protein
MLSFRTVWAALMEDREHLQRSRDEWEQRWKKLTKELIG